MELREPAIGRVEGFKFYFKFFSGNNGEKRDISLMNGAASYAGGVGRRIFFSWCGEEKDCNRCDVTG